MIEDGSGDEESAAGGCGRVVEGEIDGVMSCNEYPSCISCKSKVKKENDVIGECSKCGLVMKLSKCPNASMVKVLIGGQDRVVTMFEGVISKVVDGVSGKNLTMKLLGAPALKFFV